MLAWHVAAFSRTRKLKSLRAYLDRRRRGQTPPPEISDEERSQIVQAATRWAEALNQKGR